MTFIAAIPNALSLAGVLFPNSIWGAIICLIVVALIMGYRREWVQAVAKGSQNRLPVIATWLRKPFTGLVLSLFASLIVLLVVSMSVSASFLQPRVFIGYDDGMPVSVGRQVASIVQITEGNGQFCGQAIASGRIKNTSDQPIQVFPYGNTIISSQSPSLPYNVVAQTGVPPGVWTTIQPGRYSTLTVVGNMNQDTCQDYKEDDLQALRRGRLNVTGQMEVKVGDSQQTTSISFALPDLPIANGD